MKDKKLFIGGKDSLWNKKAGTKHMKNYRHIHFRSNILTSTIFVKLWHLRWLQVKVEAKRNEIGEIGDEKVGPAMEDFMAHAKDAH